MKAIQFYTNLTETLKENLGTDWTIELHTDVILNNGTNHIAMILYKNGEKLHPQIYLERFFEDYKRGKSMKEILQVTKRLPRGSLFSRFLFWHERKWSKRGLVCVNGR